MYTRYVRESCHTRTAVSGIHLQATTDTGYRYSYLDRVCHGLVHDLTKDTGIQQYMHQLMMGCPPSGVVVVVVQTAASSSAYHSLSLLEPSVGT